MFSTSVNQHLIYYYFLCFGSAYTKRNHFTDMFGNITIVAHLNPGIPYIIPV